MFERVAALGLVLFLFASCGDDPNALKGGRRGPHASSGGQASSTTGGDETPGASSSDDGSSAGAEPGSASGSGSGSGSEPTGATPATAEALCVDTINKYRATLGLPPLARWTAAESCSNDQAKNDASTGAGHGSFGRCRELGQNECPAWPGPADKMIPDCLAAMWSEGPGGGHFENMASKRWTKVACGFSPGGSVWSVQNFQ